MPENVFFTNLFIPCATFGKTIKASLLSELFIYQHQALTSKYNNCLKMTIFHTPTGT